MRFKIFHTSLRAEILRTDRITTESSNFKLSSQTLILRIINQDANLKPTVRYLGKIYGKNFDIF